MMIESIGAAATASLVYLDLVNQMGMGPMLSVFSNASLFCKSITINIHMYLCYLFSTASVPIAILDTYTMTCSYVYLFNIPVMEVVII